MNFRISIPFAAQSFLKTKPTNHMLVRWYGQFEQTKTNKGVVLTQAYMQATLLELKFISEFKSDNNYNLKEEMQT